ncbi:MULTISPECIES: 4Fe-4S dicluster domain-containing protein [unclassified Adlercreutzia]|uniref:4Fe-4S dicluster domain-containing protein n=1 Tax=unclassified Adlercreutzia TaxID=2636013 RepID=UPI0013ED2598|nr:MULTISPECIES: 4Fe-4S dicluster domain-containing protein [unclassified Adlercreutzia]
MEYGLLIHFEWCTGCHACEVACRNEHDFPIGKYGIKLTEQGPWQYGKNDWEWDYVPITTNLCDMCKDRIDAGEKPACVHHCMAEVMDFGTKEEILKKSAELKGKCMVLFNNK